MAKKKTKEKHIEDKSIKNKVFGRNIVLLILLFILLITVYELVPSYKWVNRSLIKRNNQIIRNNPHLDVSNKYQLKLGFDYSYISYVKNNTPENAVILIPPAAVFRQGNFNAKGAWGVKSKSWSTYFLYPRMVVDYQTFQDDSSMASRVTHIMIINGWGYELLDYTLKNKYENAILPFKIEGMQK